MLSLGFRKADISTLTVDEMISIVVAAPPNSAVYHAVNGGYTITDHLLATIYEHQAGLVHPTSRIERPGVTDTRPARPARFNDYSTPVKQITFDVMSIDELEQRRGARIKGA